MDKLLAVIFFILLLASCKPEGRKVYGEGFKNIWSHKQLDWNPSSLIENKGFIYGLTGQNKLFKAEIKTGKINWVKQALPNYSFQKPLIINNTIFIGGRDSVFAYDINGNLQWKQVTGEKIGHTLLIYDTLLIGSVRSKGLFAFNQNTGKPIWSIEPAYQMLSSSDPAIIDSLIIVGDFDYKKNTGTSLYCFNANNRKIIWSFPTKHYLTSEAEVKGNKLFINLNSSYADGYTKGLDLQTGRLIWERKTYADPNYKPFILNNRLFIGSFKYGLLCLNPENGKIIWKLNLDQDYPNTKIIIHKNRIIFGTNTNRALYKINLNGQIITKTDFEYGLGDPFIYNDTLFVNTGGGKLYKEIKIEP